MQDLSASIQSFANHLKFEKRFSLHTLRAYTDDLIQFSTEEYRFFDIPDRYCNTSSIMMQKKNVISSFFRMYQSIRCTGQI